MGVRRIGSKPVVSHFGGGRIPPAENAREKRLQILPRFVSGVSRGIWRTGTREVKQPRRRTYASQTANEAVILVPVVLQHRGKRVTAQAAALHGVSGTCPDYLVRNFFHRL